MAGGIGAASFVLSRPPHPGRDGGTAVRLTDPAISSLDPGLPIAAFITPHHLVAVRSIEKIFQEVSDTVGGDTIGRVILVSPNHFNIGRDWVIGSDRDWETPSGLLRADTVVIDGLRDSAFIGRDIFEREHGIRNILPSVKRYFPQATIVPLALRGGMPDDRVDALAERLGRLSDPHTILIVSADFSHYLDWNFSRFHDEKSIETLDQQDFSHVDSLDIDCVSCARLAMRYAELRGAPQFHLVSRSSALEFSGINRVGEETSHVTGYFAPMGEPAGSRSAQFLFAGGATPGWMTEKIPRIFMGQDGNISRADDGIRIGTHQSSSDSGRVFLDSGGALLPDGQPFAIRAVADRRIAFARPDAESIRQARQSADVVVVVGERAFRPDETHGFIDAGSDVVVGMGGDSLSAIELYRGKVILPSLGTLSPRCRVSGQACTGVMVGVGFVSGATEYVLMPVVTDVAGQAILATSQTREAILGRLAGSVTDAALREAIRGGAFVLHDGEGL